MVHFCSHRFSRVGFVWYRRKRGLILCPQGFFGKVRNFVPVTQTYLSTEEGSFEFIYKKWGNEKTVKKNVFVNFWVGKKAAQVVVFGGQLRYFGGTVAFIRGAGLGMVISICIFPEVTMH